MAENVTLTNRALGRMHNALKLLAMRSMDLKVDLKVTRMLRILGPYVEPLDAARRKVILDVSAEVGEDAELTPMQEQIMGIHIQERQAQLDGETVEIALPVQFALTADEMPKEKTGKDGWKNAEALAAIMDDLGPLYLMDEKDEEE